MSIAVTLVLVAVGAQGLPPVGLPSVSRPPCDSPDVEAVATVAQDYLNSQHTHGYKYVLNRIEDVKVITTVSLVGRVKTLRLQPLMPEAAVPPVFRFEEDHLIYLEKKILQEAM